ncbi:hypothetical protein YV76_004599 [Salmonella enterica subsp. enterica]|nr:hypothetical protein [Salmonella enterica subsp. enterica]
MNIAPGIVFLLADDGAEKQLPPNAEKEYGTRKYLSECFFVSISQVYVNTL